MVEDNATVGGLIFGLLREEGFHALRAWDSRAAARLARERSPDLILLDLGLPYRDGLGLLRELRVHQEMKDAPILVVTGSPLQLTVEERAQVLDVISKPFDIDRLMDTIRACLGQEQRGPRFADLQALRARAGDHDHYPW